MSLLDKYTQSRILDILGDLGFIESWQEGKIVSVYNKQLLDRCKMTSVIRRCWTMESRSDAKKFIQSTINTATDIMLTYTYHKINSKDHSVEQKDKTEIFRGLCIRICEALKKSIRGMKNITITYKDDSKFVSDINSLIELANINIKIFTDKMKTD